MAKKEDITTLRHSTSHILAHAVKKLFPRTKLGIGPAIEGGFYYDFDVKKSFTPEDTKKIEYEMNKLIRQNLEFKKQIITKQKAKTLFKDEPYKLELIDELEGSKVTIYTQGDFTDLCKGPHVENSKVLKAFKLTKTSGAYWRGDSKNKMLQRVYGIVFHEKEELKKYIQQLQEAEKRDHRKIGQKLDLFSMHDEAPGMPFFHDKGTFIFNTLIDFMRNEMNRKGYEENRTPIILNKELWLKSGHWDHYKENMYFTKIDTTDYAVKPMNCPGNLLIYKTKVHSYRDLPLKAGEFGLVHRHELSGVLAGLFRVRAFTQDDAHVFCEENQLKDSIIELIELCDYTYKTFGFTYEVELSTRPEKAMGSKEIWDKAEKFLKQALNAKKIKYKINEGEGAFYGPKIDFHLKDCIGRKWQCGTIQVDFSMPEKFDLTYEGKDGKSHHPVMVHRAIYGSLERFLGILIEHYGGNFPLWLSPIQVRILTVADRFNSYADKVSKEMKDSGLRVEVDKRAESISKKVREAQLSKINYILVVGEKEVKDKTITVRTRDNVVHGAQKVDSFIKKLLEENNKKR
ncbi:threonine--tRNA ligase [Candidatus Woesearchaeota archaeon B3_Woes]|nr:MAG: threonine--tRNA ligase [Candidatus Woesearchaeota archaeon B3_Woes]